MSEWGTHMAMRSSNPQRYEPDNVIALAKRLHRVDEPTDLKTSIEWDGLLEGTRKRYIAYAKVALRFTEEN